MAFQKIPITAGTGGDHDDGRDKEHPENPFPRRRAAANGDGGTGSKNRDPVAMRTRNSPASALAGKLDVPSAILADALGITIRLRHLKFDG